MIRTSPLLLAIALSAGFPAAASAQPGSIARGELLYSTHCHECHTQQMHWRGQKLVTNWASLTAQVRRWQANTGRTWDAGDTEAVACYLNANFYHLKKPGREACVP